jgi:hypothetical protein
MPCSTQTEARSSPTGSSRQLTAFREVVHEWWNILATIAQRWNADDEGTQPEIPHVTRSLLSRTGISLAARRWLRRYVVCAHSARGQRARGFRAFSDNLLQDVAIQRQVGDQLLQLAVFVAQRPQLADLLDANAGELFFPAVERLLADPEAATDLGDLFPAFPPGAARRRFLRSYGLCVASCAPPDRSLPPSLGDHNLLTFTLSVWRFVGVWVTRSFTSASGS